MYQQYFHFNSAPFSIAPDPHFIFMSEQHQEGLALLLYGIRQEGGFVALTGEVGTGKTMLCHCLLEQLPQNVDIALVLNPKLNTLELLATICDELQIEYKEEKQSIKHLIDGINKHLLAAHAENRKTILMIDEAQNLSLDVLEQIRLLTNLETSKSKLLQIILVGQPELKQLLDKPELRQLNQRIIARYHLTPLSYPETQDYISHRLAISGAQTIIFNRAAVKKVYQLSKGIPRLVNVICDRALLGAYAASQKQITAKTIVQAAKENFNTAYFPLTLRSKKMGFSIAMLVFLLVFAYFINKNQAIKGVDHLFSLDKEIAQKNKPLLSRQQNQTLAVAGRPEKASELLKAHADDSASLGGFLSTITQKKSSLESTLPRLIGINDNKMPDDLNCDQLKVLGIECLLEQSNWKKLIAFNRPAIMEFSISATEKTYVLLVGFNGSEPVFQFENEAVSFPVAQVLAGWDGYFLLLWQPPVKHITFVYPQRTSKAVFWLRKQLPGDVGELTDPAQADFFDDALKAQVTKFQKRNKLSVDGVVGFRTFIQLQNEDPQNNYPQLRNK